MHYVYLDHNVVDAISKGWLALGNVSSLCWVYSNEHFKEIRRAGETYFLDTLTELEAHRLELDLDEHFRITGGARITNEIGPHELYRRWLDANSEAELSDDYFIGILSRLHGAENLDRLLSLPDELELNLCELLADAGIAESTSKELAEIGGETFEALINEGLLGSHKLEVNREALGLHKGRAGKLMEEDNPLEALWSIICPTIQGTADQFFGFEAHKGDTRQEQPLFLGIIGCYTVLNMMGLRPDKKLADETRMPAIMSDASHAAYAAYCQALLSGDHRMCLKARAIYRYKNIGTQVLQLRPRAS